MKNLIISAVIGLLFMGGGFYFGNKLAPKPPAPNPEVAATAGGTAPAPAPEPISIEALKKTSEEMMTVNQALQGREEAVALRERKAKEREDELNAERAALDRTHEKFRELFADFQSRLQLVEANQMDELNKQAELYTTMSSDQAIDLMRAMDDQQMTRLFSVMDTKPLAKMMADWKTKYPTDGPRLLHALNGMANVLPKEKIALSDDNAATPETTTPDASTPSAPATDSSAPAPADPPTPATAPAPDAPATPPPAPPADSTTPAASPADSTPSLPAPPDNAPQHPVSTAATN